MVLCLGMLAGCRNHHGGGAAPAEVTFLVSGNAGAAGATLAYTDGTARTATADSSGNYSFTVPGGWSGTVTPSLPGYAFTPASLSCTNVQEDETGEDFTAAAAAGFTISGNAGAGGANLLYTDGGAKAATADGSGNYQFTVAYGWSGTVTPSLVGYGFTPASRSYTQVLADQTGQDFTAAEAPVHYLSGYAGLEGVTLTYNDGVPETITAGYGGLYFTVVPAGWSGTLTPSMAGYTFNPPSLSFTNVQADLSNQNFAAVGVTFAIAGNAGAGGATLAYTDGTARTATADGSGNYSFTVSYGWSGTVTPSLQGHAFTPQQRTYANVLSGQSGQDYTASTGAAPTISGNAGVAGATLAYTDGTARTATAGAGGDYSFTVSYNWTGTVTPAAPLRNAFTPASRSYTGLLADQALQDYTANPGIFTATGSMASPRYDQTATRLAGGKVLVAGGNGSPTVTSELYDPATALFSSTATYCDAKSGHTSTLLADGRVLLAGGQNGTEYLGYQLYYPYDGYFSYNGPMVTPRALHTATLLPDGKVLVAGGENFIVYGGGGTSGDNLASAELFDPATNLFTATGDMTTKRAYATATLLPGGKVLVAGGSSYSVMTILATAELYDPATGLFTATGSMVTGREYHTATLLPDGKVLFVGGQAQSRATLASAELYDPATGQFTATGSMGAVKRLHTAVLLASGKVLIAGGDYSNTGLTSAELYDPATGTFTDTGSLGTARDMASSTLLTDGTVLLEGGFQNITSSELYVPQDPAPGFPCIAYDPPVLALVRNVAMTAVTPSATGAVSWSIAPDLPDGLLFDPVTGAITGTPTAASSARAYAVTAGNGARSSSTWLWVTVKGP